MATKEKKAVVKRPPRTMKERKFAKAYLETGNGVQSALRAYDTTNYASANTIAGENLQKLSFDHYFDKAGLTDEVIAQNVSVMALTAKKRDQFSGEYDEDYSTKLKATELALKIMKKIGDGSQTTNVQVNVMPILGGSTQNAV